MHFDARRLFRYVAFPAILLSAVTAAGISVAPAESTTSAPYRTAFSAAVDGIVNAEMLDRKIPSVTVAVVHHGHLIHVGAYGLEHAGPDVETRPTTLYLLDSITKQFTASAIMLLVQDGKMRLDDPVKKYVPYTPKLWDGVTIRHLLTHTSGLPDDPKWGYPSIKDQDDDPDRILKHYIFNQRLKASPGSKEVYSNTGYAALAAILSKVSGQPYSRFLEERIFTPVGMTQTGIDKSGAVVKRGARGYDYSTNDKEWNAHNEFHQPLGAGAIESTAMDLAKWDAALNGETILTAASKQEMWKSYTLRSGKPANYGFGWVPVALDKQLLVWHNGGGWGFNSAFYRFLGSQLTVIVLTNLQPEKDESTHADDLARKIAAAYDPDLKITSSDASPSTATEKPQTKAKKKSTDSKK